MKDWFLWLYPGLKVKRYLLLMAGGLLCLVLGLYLAAGPYWIHWPALLGWEERRRLLALGLGILGLAATLYGGRQMVRSILWGIFPGAEGHVGEKVWARRYLRRGPRAVALGGGTGLSTLLRGLKHYTHNLTAIVSVTDDGGSSGRLRQDMGIQPPGDVRNVLVALAASDSEMGKVLQHRFQKGELAGHSLGNLFLGALVEIFGSLEEAIRVSSEILAVDGTVLPSSRADVTLVAEFPDGSQVRGETAIVNGVKAKGPFRKLFLDPPAARPPQAALEALAAADIILLGPGSLFTSVIPHLLLPEIREGIRRSRALKVYVLNIMTQPGETAGMTARAHVEALEAYLGKGVLDVIVGATGPYDPQLLEAYEVDGAHPLEWDLPPRWGKARVVRAPLVENRQWIRHDSDKLARQVMEILLDEGLKERGRWVERLILSERLSRR
ncbi:MAG: uridine diphosphate-N-acetylglucosamine-binding protein YvcK [Bacillota bacterium]|nr:uridine diphosphate-N-acetylglucosamine-binding protein YvcK [Bacillota bacterium]